MAGSNVVPVIYKADTRQVDAELNRLGQKTKAISTINLSNFGAAQRPMGKLVGLATEFEKSMEAANARVLAFGASVGVIVGVKNAFVGLVKEAVKFNDEMVKVNSVLQVSQSSMDKFGDSLFGVAERTAQSIRDVSQAALEFSRQGLGLEETLQRTEKAMLLTRIAGIDAADATRKITAAFNSFKSQHEDVGTILDKIVKVEQRFAVDTNDLTSAIERSGAAANAAGVKFNDFLGIVTAIQEKTSRGGAVIGNAVKTIFSRLQSESRIANLENLLNIKLFDDKDQPLEMVKRIEMIAMAMKKITDPIKKEKAIFELAGTYQKNIGQALIDDVQQGKEDSVLSKAAKEADTRNSAGTAFKKNQQLNLSLMAQMEQIIALTKKVAVAFADLGTTDWIQDLLSFVKYLVSSIDGLLERTDFLGSAFKNLVKGFSSLFGPAALIGVAVVGKFFVDFVKFSKDSVQSLLHINNTSNKQKILENEINAILKEDLTMRTLILNETSSQVEIEERLNALIASRIKARETETKLVAQASMAAARSGNFSVAKGNSGTALTTTMSQADIDKARVVRAATGLSIAAAMDKEEQEKFLGGARNSDSVRTVPIRTSGGNMATGVVNASEKVMDLPGFGTVVIPKNMIEQSVAKGGISANDMNMVLPPSVAEKAGLTSKNVSPIRSRAIRDLVDGYITSGFLGFKTGKTDNLDYPAAMIKSIQGDPMKSSIFYDLFGHWRGMFAGERKTSGSTRDNLSYLNKLALEDGGIKEELYTSISSGLFNYMMSGGKSMPPLTMGKAFGKAYTMVLPTTSDAVAQKDSAGKVALDANLGRVGNLGVKGTGMLKAIWDMAIVSATKMLPPNKRATLAPLIKQYKPKVWFPSNMDFALTPESALEKAQKDPRFAEKLKNIKVPFSQFTGDKNEKGGWKYDRMIVQKPGFYDGNEIKNYAQGRIPGLDSAIGREMAAGVPASSIYVDSHSSLKSGNNPMGLMVANTRDEPLGGYQGIQRARKEGANPRNYGIPNFADKIFSSLDRGAKGVGGPVLGENATLLNQEVGRIVKELRQGSTSFDKASKEADKLKEAFQLSNKQVAKMNEKFDWAAKNIYPEVQRAVRSRFGLDNPQGRLELRPSTQEDPSVITAAKLRAAEMQRQAQASYMSSPKYAEDNRARLAPLRASIEQRDKAALALQMAQGREAKQTEEAIALRDQIARTERERLALLKIEIRDRLANPVNNAGFREMEAKANKIGMLGPVPTGPVGNRAGGPPVVSNFNMAPGANKQPLGTRIGNWWGGVSDNKKMMASFGASFALPVLGAAVDSSFISRGKDRTELTKGQRFGSSFMNEGLGFAATGAMIGGPWGAAIGAIVGLGNAALKSSLSLEELDKAAAERGAKFEERETGAKNAQALIKGITDRNMKDSERTSMKNELNRLQAKDPRIGEILRSGNINDKSQRDSILAQLRDHENYISSNKDFLTYFPTGGTDEDKKVRKESVDRIAKSFVQDSGNKAEAIGNINSTLGVLTDGTLNDMIKLLQTTQNRLVKGTDTVDEIPGSMKYLTNAYFKKGSTENLVGQALSSIVGEVPDRDKNFMVQTIKDQIYKIIEGRQGFTPEDQPREDLRKGQDRLRGAMLQSGRISRAGAFQNGLINRIEALQSEIYDVLYASLEDQQSAIKDRAATELAKANRDFNDQMKSDLQGKLKFLTQVDPMDFDLSNMDLRTKFIEPATKAAERGDSGAVDSLLKTLQGRISEFALEEDKLAIKENIDAFIENTKQLQKNLQLQNVEIQTRTLLNSTLQENEKKLKDFIQSVNEAQAKLAYDRIGKNAKLEQGINAAEYKASRFVASPWEIEANNLRTQQSAAKARMEFNVQGIREGAALEAKKLLAQTSNTAAIQELTRTLLDFVNGKKAEILGENVKDPAKRVQIQSAVEGMSDEDLAAYISGNSKKGKVDAIKSAFKGGDWKGVLGGVAGLGDPSNEEAYRYELAQAEMLRRQTKGAMSGSLDKLLTGVNGVGNFDQVVAAGERLREGGQNITKEALANELGGELGDIIRQAKPEEWSAIWDAVSQAAAGVKTEMSNFETIMSDTNMRLRDQNKAAYYEQAKKTQRQGLINNIDDLRNLPGTTPDQLVEAIQALKKFEENDPFGSFADGLELAMARLQTETLSFQNQLGQNIPTLFRDNMSQAIQDITMGTKSIEDSLLSAAASFFAEMNKAFSQQAASQLTGAIGGLFGGGSSSGVQKFARGGRVKGGSGVRDDVPAMLTGGEFVMKRSAVQKYGHSFFDSLNNRRIRGFASGGYVSGNNSLSGNVGNAIVTGALSSYFSSQAQNNDPDKAQLEALATIKKYGTQKGPDFFIPGTYTPNGKFQGAIGGQNVKKFYQQQYTSGSQDRITSDGTGALSVRMEDESINLGAYGRNNSDIMSEVRGAKEQGLGVWQSALADYMRVAQEEDAQKKAIKQQLISSVVGAVVGGVLQSAAAGASGAVAGNQAANAANGQTTSFWGNLGAGLKGAWSGYEGQGGLSNIFSGTGFQTYAPKAIMIDEATGAAIPAGSPVTMGGNPSYQRVSSGGGSAGNIPLPTFDSMGVPDTFNGDLTSDVDLGRQAFYNPAVATGMTMADWLKWAGENPVNMGPDPDFMRGYQGRAGSMVDEDGWYGVLPPLQRMSGGNIPAVLNHGEHILNSQTAARYGKGAMSNLNRGVTPMMDGGEVGTSTSTGPMGATDKLIAAIEKLDETTRKPEINITIQSGPDGSVNSTTETKNAREEDKKLADKINALIQKALIEEKRQGGMMR